MAEHIDDALAREKLEMRIRNKEGHIVPYNELSIEEKKKFDEQYPYSGYTYEEYCGMRS